MKEINYPINKKMKPSMIKKGIIGIALGLGVALVAPSSVPANQINVEAAKKDRTKPKIKFKGNTKISAEEGEKVTIPKTTYSDNLTKKKKLKVGVTVKKGKKNYKTIANKIKKATLKSQPVTVTFDEEGTYKITYSITDTAKNVATKARYVTVTSADVIEEEKVDTKQDPATTEQITTEAPTTEEPKRTVPTETPSTEQKSTEKTTEESDIDDPIEERTPIDYSKYDIKTVKVGENTYNYIRDDYFKYDAKFAPTESSKIILNIENAYDVYKMDINNNEIDNCDYFRYFGKITAYDEEGNDISNQVVITDIEYKYLKDCKVGLGYIYVKDSKGNDFVYEYELDVYNFDNTFTDDYFGNDYEIINDNPKVYARKISLNIGYDDKNNRKLVIKLV